jgi:hypothetical protein
MTVVPNPRRFGAEMGGPSRSVQLIVKMSPTVLQQTFTRPLSVGSDAFKEMAQDRTGARGDLKAAWFHYTQRGVAPVRASGKGFSVYTKKSSARDASWPHASLRSVGPLADWRCPSA